METNVNGLKRYASRGTLVALLAVLAIFLFAAVNVSAQPAQPIVVSQITWGAAWPNGGAFSGENVAGNTWAMNSKGVVVASETYGGSVLQFSSPGYTQSVAGPVSNGSGVAIDSNDNLYVSDEYNQEIVKIAPTGTVSGGTYTEGAAGTYSWTTDPTGSTAYAALPVCTNVNATDQAAGMCAITEPASIGYFGIEGMAIDKAGNLYMASDDSGAGTGSYGTPAYSIYKCSAGTTGCLAGTAAPVLVYSEPLSTTPSTTGQLYLGGLAFDQQGNLYFTDSAVSKDSNQTVVSSHLNELQATTAKLTGFGGATTGFVAAPTILITQTNATPGQYDDHIGALWVDKGVGNPGAGTVYFGLANSGIYAMPATKGVVNTAGLYAITNQGTKMVMEDPYGNLLIDGYTTAVNPSGADTFAYIGLSGPTFPGTATTAKILVADNTEPCPASGLSLTFTDSEFSPGAPGTCSSSSIQIGSTTGVAALVPYTITLTPVAGVPPSGSMTAEDSTSGASSTTIAKGGVISSVDQSTWGPKFLAGGVFGADSADSHSAAINDAGFVFMGTSYGSGQIQQFQRASNGTITVTEVGPLSGAGGMAVDGNNFLYASGEYENTILKLPAQTSGTYAGTYTPFTSTTGLSNCTGTASDSAGMCQIVLGGSTWTTNELGISALIFDSKGDLFFDTNDEGTAGNGQYSVYECPLTCLYGSSPTAPVLLFAETVPSDANSDQYYPGPIALDSKGDVFFTDALIDVGGSSYVHVSNLWELPVNTSNANGYAATPTLLETISPACTAAPCKYNNDLDGLVIDKNNNIFLADQYTGIYELPSGSYDAPPIAIAAPGAKSIVEDNINVGNFFFSGYNGGDSIGYDLVGSANIAGYATAAAPTSASVDVLDNFGCDQGDTFSFSFTTDPTAFAGTQGGTSNMALGGGCGITSTLTFTPGASLSGPVSTKMTVDDTVNGGSISNVPVSALAATAQVITGFAGITSPVVYGSGPYTLSATGGGSGNPVVFSVDASSTAGVAAVSGTNGTTLTITGVGSLVIDANQAGGTVGGVTYAPAAQLQVPITVNKAPQVITFKPTSPVSYTTTPITLSATGGASGNPVIFSIVSGPGTLSGTNEATLTITGVGTIVIAANQAGNTDYAAAAAVDGSIVVNQAPQTITFTPPASIGYGLQITLSATGGASGNPVTFTLDETSTAGAGALSGTNGSTLTATGLGTIVVDANQAGNTDYAAATQVQAKISVTPLGVVATPAISPATGSTLIIGTSNTVTITDGTAGATILYTTDGSNPLTSGTAQVYDGAFKVTAATYPATVTVNAAGTLAGYTPSAVGTSTYTLQVIPPDFTLGAPSSVTVTPGTSVNITITVVPNAAFTSPITFACSGAPAGVTCTFVPATITPPATTSTVLTITASASAALQHGSNPFLPGGVTFAIALGFLGWKKRRSLLLALVLMAVVIGVTQLSACGGTTPPKTTTTAMTITATGGGVTVTLPISVIVEQ